jgi:hypothetical protein
MDGRGSEYGLLQLRPVKDVTMASQLKESARSDYQGEQPRVPEASGRSPTRRQEQPAANPPANGAHPRLEQEIAQQVSRSVMPVFEEISQSMIQATEPILRQYQQQIAEVVARQVAQASPSRREQSRQAASEETEQSPRTMPGAEQQRLDGQSARDAEQEPAQSSREQRLRTPDTADRNKRDTELTGAPMHQNGRGGTDMATKTDQTNQAGNQEETRQPDSRDARQSIAERPKAESAMEPRQRRAEVEAVPAGTYSAISAYERVLVLYPDTDAAAAAADGLLDLADTLAKQGKFYTALNIYDKLAQLL